MSISNSRGGAAGGPDGAVLSPPHPVMLVGAGPGDPDLLTVKALRAIEAADVIVYDKLVAEPILALTGKGTTLIFAGKQAKRHHMPQEETNALLVRLARAGRRVVRLKGGDPFVFGRGGEEALYLAAHGVPFEVVPGITSSAGCAAYAGIPLTHRGLAHGVRFVTGHTLDGETLNLNWRSLADPDTTLVVYMGLTHLAKIARNLVAHGLPGDTPAAAINLGTRPEQRTVTAPLLKIADAVAAAEIKGATLLVIGRVAGLAPQLQWFEPALAADQPTTADRA